MSKDESLKLLMEYANEKLLKHSLCVAFAMQCYARKFNEDEEKWFITGLLHDLDYEKYPDKHPYRVVEILKERNFSEDVIDAILGHAKYTNVERKTSLAKTLFAVDELSGFLYAYALVRPSKNLEGVKIKSIKKKLKDKSFARGVDRDDIMKGAQELGVDLSEHIIFVAKCLQDNAKQLGLAQ